MTMSNILQQSTTRDGPLAGAIGRELRRRRLAAGFSQAAVGAPFTRAFVCAIERGRAMPSIASLAVILDHLDITFDDFFRGVQLDMTMRYTPPHGDRPEAPSCRRR